MTLGRGTSVWYGSVLRGDADEIIVGADCNIQDLCCLHTDEGEPTVLAHDGKLEKATLRRLGIRPRDVEAALRDQGAKAISDVEQAELMPSGSLLVVLRDEAQTATRADIGEVLRRLTELENAVRDRG